MVEERAVYYIALGIGRDAPDKVNTTQRYNIQKQGNNQGSADTTDLTTSAVFIAVLVTRGYMLWNPQEEHEDTQSGKENPFRNHG